jgi:hypothetical protein
LKAERVVVDSNLLIGALRGEWRTADPPESHRDPTGAGDPGSG